MTLYELKKYIELAKTKDRENPHLQRQVNTAGADGIGAGIGSITLAQEAKQEKKAEFSWDKVTREIEKLRTAFNKQDTTTKALLATGGGAIGGMALSSLLGGKAGRGAMLGAMAGGASQVDWRKLLTDIADPNANKVVTA